MIALIPARSGSKRIPQKNMAILGGKPLLQIAIENALKSRIFNGVFVSSDSEEYLDKAFVWGAIPIERPKEMATDNSPDIEWVRHALGDCTAAGSFAILRPTNPFRTAGTIQRAYHSFILAGSDITSLRAVQLCKEHPCKMWMNRVGQAMMPLVTWMTNSDVGDMHSRPYQSLPEVYVQNASLEMAWTKTVTDTGTIAGDRVAPFMTQGYEGFDINTREDLILAEALMERGMVMI